MYLHFDEIRAVTWSCNSKGILWKVSFTYFPLMILFALLALFCLVVIRYGLYCLLHSMMRRSYFCHGAAPPQTQTVPRLSYLILNSYLYFYYIWCVSQLGRPIFEINTCFSYLFLATSTMNIERLTRISLVKKVHARKSCVVNVFTFFQLGCYKIEQIIAASGVTRATVHI